jgi:hypothetical protein
MGDFDYPALGLVAAKVRHAACRTFVLNLVSRAGNAAPAHAVALDENQRRLQEILVDKLGRLVPFEQDLLCGVIREQVLIRYLY